MGLWNIQKLLRIREFYLVMLECISGSGRFGWLYSVCIQIFNIHFRNVIIIVEAAWLFERRPETLTQWQSVTSHNIRVLHYIDWKYVPVSIIIRLRVLCSSVFVCTSSRTWNGGYDSAKCKTQKFATWERSHFPAFLPIKILCLAKRFLCRSSQKRFLDLKNE